MQVTYQQTLDDWIAVQIFQTECSFRFEVRKGILTIIILACSIAFLALFVSDAHLFWFFCIFVLFTWIIAYLHPSSSAVRADYCGQLLSAYGSLFDKEEDKMVSWNISPEAIIKADKKKETRYRWDAVQKIVVCPDYLFIDFGGLTGWLSFPGGAVAETVYQALCEEVISTYREQAARAGKLADVIHSEWTIDLGKLKKRRIWGW